MKEELFSLHFILIKVIEFLTEETPYQIDFSTSAISDWLQDIISQRHFQLVALNYIFCSDEYLLKINQTYLQHDYYTDIITFDNSDEDTTIEGDIFISIDRVRENAEDEHTSFHNELYRVIAHGLLHLIGFGDKTDEEAATMREMENNCLNLLSDRL